MNLFLILIELFFKQIRQIYTEIYSNDSHIDNSIRLISFHPNFLREFTKLYNHLMYSQGALPYESRHFIAIMAAAKHKCYYLVKQQENEFIQQNGQKQWLQGIRFVPQKLRDLFELNKLLCHKPWLINQFHIKVNLKLFFCCWNYHHFNEKKRKNLKKNN